MDCERVLRSGRMRRMRRIGRIGSIGLRLAASLVGVAGVAAFAGLVGLNGLMSGLMNGLPESTGVIAEAHAADYGAVLAGSQSEFWKAMEQGIDDAAAEGHANVIVRSPVDDDPQTKSQNLQLKMVQWMIDGGVKSLILAPIPVDGVKTPVQLPVPVIFVDRPSNDYRALSTVSTDNYTAGRVAARTLEHVLPRGAKVGVLRLAPDVVSTGAREQGFIDQAKAIGFEIAVDAYIGHGIHEPELAAIDAIKSYGRPLDAIFTPTDFTTLAVVRALDELAPKQRPKLVGFDYRPIFKQYLQTGVLHAVIAQDAYQMGYIAMQTLLKAQAGAAVPPRIDIDVLALTAANIDDPSIGKKLRQYQ